MNTVDLTPAPAGSNMLCRSLHRRKAGRGL